MRALGFDVKKHEVVKLVHDVDPRNHDNVNFGQFLEISTLRQTVAYLAKPWAVVVVAHGS